MDLVGQNLGQYRIVDPIGAGGMATVYKAYQPGLDRYVAVKVLPAQHALTPGFKQRFFREAKAVAQLSHPNILPIYDVGIENDVSYFVMKYVPGRTLQDVMGQSLTLEKTCEYIDQLAGALDHAHNKGILHRDIKPVNVLMEDEWLLLADFGLAKIVEGSEALTATGSSMGTPAYVSPEQATGKPVDHRTDIYSLGVVLYEMVTGNVPYSGETPMGVMFKHVYEPLPMPRKVKPELPEAVERVILKALAKNPDDRFNSAGELAKALREAVETGTTQTVLSSTPIVAPTAPADKTIDRQPGVTSPATAPDTAAPAPAGPARPFWLWAGAALLLVLVAAGGAFYFFNQDSGPEAASQNDLIVAEAADGDDPANATAQPAAEEAAEIARTAATPTPEQAQEPAATKAVAAEEPVADTPTATTEAAEEAAAAEPAEEPTGAPKPNEIDIPTLEAAAVLGRGPIHEIATSPNGDTLAVAGSVGVWLYSLPGLEMTTLLPSREAGILAVNWSPDGSQLAAGSNDGRVQVWDVDNEQMTQTLAGHTDAVISVSWSGDGTQLAAGSRSARIKVWDVAGGQEVSELFGHLYEPYGLAWSPDNTQLASASRDATVRVWDVASGGELQKLEGHLDEVNSIDWSDDGSQLLTSSNDLTIRVWDTQSWQEQNILTGHTDWVIAAAWSPDGSQIASSSMDGTVRIWEAATGTELLTLQGHTQPGTVVSWLANGTQVVSGGTDGTLRLWDLAGGQEVAVAAGHTSFIKDVAWSPDGSQLAAAGIDGAVRLWDAGGQEQIKTLTAEGTFLQSVTWSPDGSQIATGNSAGTVQIWDVLGGETLHTLTGHEGQVNSVAWSPDGRQVASASADGTVRVWDSVSGASLRELAGHSDAVNSVTWSPTGEQLATGGDDYLVIVWDAVSGNELRRLEGRRSTETYKFYYPARPPAWVNRVDWSADGKRLVTAGADYVVRLFDTASGAELRIIEGPEVQVFTADWAPDNERVAFTGVGGSTNVTIWHALSDEPLYALAEHTGTVRSVDWSPDGTQLASAGDDGVIRIWEIPAR